MWSKKDIFGVVLCILLSLSVFAEERVVPASNEDEPGAPVGARPYEMDWAGRTAPAHPELVSFEDLTGWRVRCFDGADAQLYRSKQELIFGDYTGKVVYSGKTSVSRFVIEPPEPLPIPGVFTGANLWVRGNNWGFMEPPATARVAIAVLVRDAKGQNYRISLGAEDFDYWSLMHETCVSPDGKARHYESLGEGNDGVIDFPAAFTGIEISGCSNEKPARLYFDALSLYEIQYPPLKFDPIPESPPYDPWSTSPDATPVAASGDYLPWPTTPDTILPTVTTPGSVTFSYKPATGTLSDLTAEAAGQTFQPCLNGGITFEIDGKRVRPGNDGVETSFLGESVIPAKAGIGDAHIYNWSLKCGDASLHYFYKITIKNKSCIIAVAAETDSADGGHAVQFDIGPAKGLANAKAVYIPYLTYGDDWPRVVCSDGPGGPVFLLSLLDYYNSDASELFGAPRLSDPDAVGYAGGAVYNPTTAGVRNPLRERLFINVGSDVHEVLPNIPNPDSDTIQIAREYLWCNIGDLFQNEHLSKFKAYGIDKFIACHHEVGWREGGESFTMRDKPAPSIGADKLKEYSAFVRGLGYRFGTYTNYVDFAPVNANWNEDDVCLDSEGRWQRAWPRCYALKPLRAAEKEAHYAPLINQLYGTTAQYCDVHTAYSPWGRTDYDARSPGAGKFRTQFNAFARLLWNESKAHKGPVFSEGNHHWFYAGIVDGDYATMLPYGRGWQVPHIVDFDLLKMHTKMTDFGMGFGQMYFGMKGEWMNDGSRLSPYFDRFHAATIAFGHIGFLSYEWGFEGTLKSYYLLQALQQRYTGIPVKSIQYFDGEKLVDTSTALLTDAYKRQQIRVEYESGLITCCNLSFEDNWTVEAEGQTYELPPASFVAWKPGDILAYSSIVNGHRHDFVQCADYLYLDTRGELVRTPAITARGTVAVKRDGKDKWWIIPATKSEEVTLGFDWLGASDDASFTATAHKESGESLGAVPMLRGEHELTVMPSMDPLAAKYCLSLTGIETDGLPHASRIEVPRRELIVGTAMPLTVSVVPPNAETREFEASLLGYPGENAAPERHIRLTRADGEAMLHGSIDFQMPADVPAGKRVWVGVALQLPVPGQTAACYRFIDIVAKAPFDVAFPADRMQVRASEPFALITRLTSNFAEPVEANLQLDMPRLVAEPLKKTVHCEPGVAVPVKWSVKLTGQPESTQVTLRAETGGHSVEQSRYLRVRPTRWVVADLTKTPYTLGQCLRGQAESPYDHIATLALVNPTNEKLGEESLESFHMHPPYKDGKVGYVFACFDVALPEGRPALDFSLGFGAGSTSQDGCVFKVVVVDEGKTTDVFSEQYATLSAWARRSADLSAFAGKQVKIKLVADVGPADNSYSDWALWGAPEIVMDEPAVEVRFLDEKPKTELAPPPEPLADLAHADLAKIASAKVTLDTAGVDGGPYTSYVYFNNVKIGTTPAAPDVQWTPGEIPLNEEALRSIGPINTVVIKNPNQDCMKVRAMCLRFTLDDGRRGSSWVDTGPYCSSAGWKYDEGISVPTGSGLPEIMLTIPLE